MTQNFNISLKPYVHGFLKLAESGIESLFGKEDGGKEKWYDDQAESMYSLSNGGMVIAIIFNIRHGIEMILKNISAGIDGKFIFKHDLNILTQDLENKLGNHHLEEHLERLKQITKRYNEWEFSREIQSEEPMNQLCRFGLSNDGQTRLRYKFVHSLTSADLEIFANDCFNLRRVNDLLEGQHSYLKAMTDLGVDLKQAKNDMRNVVTVRNPGFR